MDDRRFDELTRFLGVSVNRKRFLGFVAGIVGPVALAAGIDEVDAKNKKKAKKRRRARRNGGVGSQGNGGSACGAECSVGEPCPDCSPNGECIPVGGGAGGAGVAGLQGLCAARCTNFCDFSENPDGDCSFLSGNCICVTNDVTGEGIEQIAEGCYCFDGCRCEGPCAKKKKAECPDLPGCVCSEAGASEGQCTVCPGFCSSNSQCTEQGADNCVCFFGSGVNVADVSIQGAPPTGSCGTCLPANHTCNASTECCGQLVCLNGTCQQKPTPKPKRKKRERRCHKHGQSCTGDNNCCAQGICYGGKCGEKDTHCDHDSECARGYKCVGGRDTGGHRRCRRRRVQRKRNRG